MTTVVTESLDAAQLREHLRSADSGVLLAVLTQVTGDLGVLDHFRPDVTHVRDAPEWSAAAAPEVAEAIVEELVAALTGGAVSGAALDPELFAQVAPMALGVPVADEFLPMLLEQGGFQRPQPVLPRRSKTDDTLSIAIIGGGLAGIAAAIAATDEGLSYEVFERNEELGGTWLIQNYPGVGVDTPSTYYSLSTDLNPDWTSYYPKGGEYQEYLTGLADTYGIREHTRFGVEVESLAWDESKSHWDIAFRSGDGTLSVAHASAVITAAGYLNRPQYPELPGRESFSGISVHSAEWDPALDLTGKRVAVIGTGCTSAQIVDAVAGDVAHLTLFQRQPHWVGPRKRESDDVPAHTTWLAGRIPFYANWIRIKAYWGAADSAFPVVIVDPEWAKDHLSISPANDMLLQDCLQYIDRSFGAGSELAAKMTPDFAPFGKRIIRDPGGYYAALTQPNVVVESAPAAVTETGLITADGRHVEVDVIVYATGYHLDFLSTMEIAGREGRLLTQEWAGNDPRAYRGGTVPGFPNLFITSAPNTNPSHGGGNNFGIEVGVHYVMECLRLLALRGASSIEPTRQAYEEFVEKIDADMERTIWRHSDNAHTYYRNTSGRVIVASPWRLVDVWHEHRTPIEEHFTLA